MPEYTVICLNLEAISVPSRNLTQISTKTEESRIHVYRYVHLNLRLFTGIGLERNYKRK